MSAKCILDPSFRYWPSFATDLRKTFARIRREQKAVAAHVKPVLHAPRVLRIARRGA